MEANKIGRETGNRGVGKRKGLTPLTFLYFFCEENYLKNTVNIESFNCAEKGGGGRS